MKTFARLVAGMLMVLTALPALAAAPCRQATHSMKCCSFRCPMMENTSVGGNAACKGSEMSALPCCRSARRNVLLNDSWRTEIGSDFVSFHNQPAALTTSFAEHEPSHPRESQTVRRPSSKTLCTFLI